MQSHNKPRVSRRQLLTGIGAVGLSAAIGAGWPRDWGPLVEGDIAAQSEFSMFDRGLVPIYNSGWTKPGGVKDDYPVLAADISADIAIVGAGLAGTSLALHLAEAGVNVVVIEAKTPGWGASGRNAGHVLPILKDISIFESFPDRGAAFLEAFREHHTLAFDLSKAHSIACDAVQSGYLNAMTSEEAHQIFTEQNRHWENMGLPKPILVSGSDMSVMTGTEFWTHGVLFPNGGRVNPYRLSSGLAKAASIRGAKIFGNSEATHIQTLSKQWKLATSQGSVTADRVVFCTNAYPNNIVPEFAKSFYPLTAYALTTQPLSEEAASAIMPGGQTLAQAPIDLNPLVKDEHGRLILSSIPRVSRPEDAAWHFKNQLKWLHRVWPESRNMNIELEAYWTGRVAMRDQEFPGAYEIEPGLYGLMHFNAWGNVMAPLMGKLFAESLASGDMATLPFPLRSPEAVEDMGKQDRIIRQWMIPAARQAQRLRIL